MTFYTVALFLHIVGALGLFVALGLEWVSLWHLKRATLTEEAHPWLSVFTSLRRIYPASWMAILLPGFYMMATVWGGAAWITIALAAIILIAVLGAVLTGPRMMAVGRAVVSESGALSPAFRQRLDDPLLWISIQTRIAIALGIVFLMTTKPGLVGSLLAIGVAAILGVALGWPLGGRGRAKESAT